MKASLLARVAPALLLTTVLTGGVGTVAVAQTATAPATPPATSAPASTGTPQAASPPAASSTSSGSAATTAHHAPMAHKHMAANRTPGETMTQMAEQRITDLHTRLHITAQQQPQWDQFTQVMRDNAKDLDAAYQQRAATFEKMNAVENMQSYAQIEQTRAQDLQKLVPAFQTLYASLSDEQKKLADQVFRNRAEKAQQRRARTTR